jgi:hypothetical protein
MKYCFFNKIHKNNIYKNKIYTKTQKQNLLDYLPEDTKSRIIEEIETTLFFDKKLNEIIIDVIDDVIQYDILNFNNFKLYFNNVVEMDYDNKTQWLILKEYTTIENLKTVDFETIEKNFFEDIKKCFEIVGV